MLEKVSVSPSLLSLNEEGEGVIFEHRETGSPVEHRESESPAEHRGSESPVDHYLSHAVDSRTSGIVTHFQYLHDSALFPRLQIITIKMWYQVRNVKK